MDNENKITFRRILVFGMIASAVVLIAFKFSFWGYSFKKILPKNSYQVTYNLQMEGYNESVRMQTYLPVNGDHQSISDEVQNSGIFDLKINQDGYGKEAVWTHPAPSGRQSVDYSFRYIGKAVQYQIDSTITVESFSQPGFSKYLEATENIQSTHPFLQQLYQQQVGEENRVLYILQRIYDYTYQMPSKPFKGLTDALTAARLGEASCNGKSRVFVALARQAGIPTRLVGGIILNPGEKRTSHQWVEAYINGYWVPFDPLNGHFASLPSNYLELYKGDAYLFSHTPNVNFDYSFTIKQRLVADPAMLSELEVHPMNAYAAWQAFETIGIPLGLLKIIIMLPLGALIVVIFRNVIGLQTFGVFLPALIAVASRETGLFWGLLAYFIVIFLVSAIHYPLEKWGMLYTPKMAIMLVGVVIAFLLISILGIKMKVYMIAYITLFPIVLITLTAERFARTVTEEGMHEAIRITLQTMVVVAVAYFAMNSTAMESFFLAFPELFLVIIAMNILLGRWIGLRLTEYARFRWVAR